MTPDLADFATENKLINRFKIALSRVFLPKQTLARLNDVPPASFRILGCYFRRFVELTRTYGRTVRRIQTGDNQIQSDVENEKKVEELRAWLGKNE